MKIVTFLDQPDKQSLPAAIVDLDVYDKQSVMVLVGQSCTMKLTEIVASIKETGINFFGGIFPGLIYGKTQSETGIILVKLDVLSPPVMVSTQGTADFSSLTFPSFKRRRTMLTLVDGLTTGIGEFLENINNLLGDHFSFIGGGAGTLTLQQQPCLFNAEGVFQDVAICCFLNDRIRLGVRHGWERLVGPFVVTASEGNTIRQLNWQDAFEVYREAVDQDSGQTITADNFFSIAKGYPFGMIREQEEDIVRDPISVGENGALICVGEVPTNSALFILKGKDENLIQAAQQAYEESQSGLAGAKGPLLVVDCISRTLFLEDQFADELAVLNPGDSPVVGMLSLGEISSYGKGALAFFNKTIVVGQLVE